MKLIFCPDCKTIISLGLAKRFCYCSKNWGYYKDTLVAVISKGAIPLGIANSSLKAALRNRPQSGEGKEFTAFVIPIECDTIEEDEVRLHMGKCPNCNKIMIDYPYCECMGPE